MAYGVVGVLAPMIALAQPAQVPATQETNTLSEASGADTISGTQMAYDGTQQAPERYSNAEIDHRFNEVRRELLDDRASTIEWWLTAVSVFLAFLAILGFFGFREFRELKKEARAATEIAEESANKARDLVKEIEKKRNEADEFLRTRSAKEVDDDPTIAQQAADVGKDPQASLMAKTIARAIFLQKEGKIEAAIKVWQGIAYSSEEIDNELASRAWFSVGYLKSERGDKTNLEEVILAYDQAIDLDRGFALAYNNRGIAKFKLGQYDDAITDCTRAIDLNPNLAGAYNNCGIAKAKLGRIAEAHADFEKALHIGRKTGDKKALASAEKNLRELENTGKA